MYVLCLSQKIGIEKGKKSSRGILILEEQDIGEILFLYLHLPSIYNKYIQNSLSVNVIGGGFLKPNKDNRIIPPLSIKSPYKY